MRVHGLSRCIAGKLLVVLLALAGSTAGAQCPPLVVERFISADCESCWREDAMPVAGSFVLDWIVPSARGDEAPLAAAALAEAAARAAGLPADATLQRHHELQALGPRIEVEDGPAWNGYMGLRLRVQRAGKALPEGAAGYLALVEAVPAGDEGTPIPRRVVRVLAGPLKLDPSRATFEHLLALRLPPGAHADRLGAVGWVETPSGQVLALAQANAAGCSDPK